jgi:hypothetical protein
MTQFFIPEVLTPLSYTSIYTTLEPEDQIAYNQMHGLYFLEQIIFFEQIMGQPALKQIIRNTNNPEIQREATIFAEEEDKHSEWFRTLLRNVSPETYNDSDFHLLRAPLAMRAIMSFAARSIKWLPCLLWLQLMSEERALYFGRLFAENSENIDSRFLLVQKKHMADEPGHIRRDELFLKSIWPKTPAWVRRLNARLLKWMLTEFFSLPKRSGQRVVEHFLKSRPHLENRRQEFFDAMKSLESNDTYIRTLYPRKHLKRTQLLASDWPELDFIKNFLTD